MADGRVRWYLRHVGPAVVILLATGWATGDGNDAAPLRYEPGKPWTMTLPHPDDVDWASLNRPGYRYRGMEPIHERFYQYITDKRERGEELSMGDNAMIRRMQAARRWPEAPVPNEFWKSFLLYLRDRPDLSLNFAQNFMFSEALARGLIPLDMPQNEDVRKAVEYLNSGPFRARNWFERSFGRVEGWMDYYAASGAIDMTGGGAEAGAFPTDGDFNGMRIRYNVSGATLDEPKDVRDFTTSRRYTGVVHPGTLTVSGTGTAGGGCRETLKVRVWAGAEEQEVEEYLGDQGGTTRAFSVSVPVAPGTTSAGFSIRVDLRSPYGGRVLVVSGTLKQSAADAAAQQAHADALWREEVERTLRELGYEQTQAGREIEEMRQAIAGGDAAWRAYVDRKQRELGYQDAEPEARFDELASALEAGGPTWQQYAAAHGGLPVAGVPPTLPAPAPAEGELLVCRGVEDGRPIGAGTVFEQMPMISLVHRYQDATAGAAEAAWFRDGDEIVRSVTHVQAGDGSVEFTLLSGDDRPLPAGRYEVELVMPGRTPIRTAFTMGQTAAGVQTDPTPPAPLPVPAPAPPILPSPAPPGSLDALVGEWSVVMAMLDGPQPTTLSVKRDGDGVVGTLDDRINAYLRLRAAGEGTGYEGTWTDPQAGTVAVTASITPQGALIVSLVEANGGWDLLLNALRPPGGTGTGPATPAPTVTPTPVSVPDLSGDWRFNGNNYRTTLTLQHDGNRLTGTVYSVPLEEGTVLADGTVTFIRTGVNQKYTGVFSVEPDGTWKLSGTFDCPVTRTTGSLWVATRDPRGGQAPPPTLPDR